MDEIAQKYSNIHFKSVLVIIFKARGHVFKNSSLVARRVFLIIECGHERDCHPSCEARLKTKWIS